MTDGGPAAIIGMGGLSAAGRGVAPQLQTIYAGRRQPQAPAQLRGDRAEPPVAFELDRDLVADDLDGLPDDTQMLRTTKLAVIAARDAVADAGLQPAELRAQPVGVCVGTTVGCALNIDDFHRDYYAGQEPDTANVHRFVRSNPAAAIAGDLGVTGPRQTIANACAAGTDAIGTALGWIRAGRCRLALAGGADGLCRTTYNGFAALMISSPEPCTPFAAHRRGLNLGDGAAMVVLAAADAVDRCAVHGYVLGYGSGVDAYHLTAPHPDGVGLRRALQLALADAGAQAADVAYVNAHGTGTPDNDRVEAAVLADCLPGVPFSSTKGCTGHTLGAAGALEAAFTVGALNAGRLPANVGCAAPDPELPAPPLSASTAPEGTLALSESLAFGGGNSVLALGGRAHG